MCQSWLVFVIFVFHLGSWDFLSTSLFHHSIPSGRLVHKQKDFENFAKCTDIVDFQWLSAVQDIAAKSVVQPLWASIFFVKTNGLNLKSVNICQRAVDISAVLESAKLGSTLYRTAWTLIIHFTWYVTCRLVRVMRILRVYKLVRHFAGLQSLIYTLQQAYREMGLLLLLGIGLNKVFVRPTRTVQ